MQNSSTSEIDQTGYETLGQVDQNTSYLILTTPRTGSYLLCDLLRQSDVAARPNEYFSSEHQARVTRGAEVSTATYLRELRQITLNTCDGIFGAKVMWHQLSTFLLPRLRSVSRTCKQDDWGVLLEYLPNLKVIHLRRNDRAQQALSYARALRTSTWLSTTKATTGQPEDISDASIEDLQLIFNLEQTIDADETAISAFLENSPIPIKTVCYEDVAADPVGTLQEILGFLNRVPKRQLSGLQPECSKQADRQSDRWLYQYSSYKRTRVA